ncbi:MAG: DUF192 domain-containing protein [Methanobacteriaceae archaeon]|nr:DUF192 domain-containing protein [Methanobacteriaceae archaeon]
MNFVLIVNKSKGNKLGYAKIADTFFSRFKGLMLKKEIERGLILKLPKERGRRSAGIHMFFMKFPLDIIFANSKKEVVDLVTVDPWETYNPKQPAQYIIELKKGIINKTNTELGDELDFVCDYA